MTVTKFEVEEVWKGTSEMAARIRTCGGVPSGCSDSFDFQIGLKEIWCLPEANPCKRAIVDRLPVDRASRTLELVADRASREDQLSGLPDRNRRPLDRI